MKKAVIFPIWNPSPAIVPRDLIAGTAWGIAMHRNGFSVALIAAVALIAGSSGPSTAFAADLAKPIYTATPPATFYDWTGFYVGGHLGYGWSRANTNADPLPSVVAFGTSPSALDLHSSGAIGGGQVGHNWQFAPNWAFGIEADISWSGVEGSNTAVVLPGGNAATCLNCTATVNRKWDYLGTIRGRFGVTWDHWFAYGTGGFAYGSASFNGNVAIPNFTHPASAKATGYGWALGGGLEYALAGNWTMKGEYLYIQLNDGGNVVGNEIPMAPPFAYRYTWEDTKIHTFRFGLNYKFGTPFAAKY